ncbi:hypothetical protein V8E54_005579 [Elaphomyces granulatus]
MQGHSHRHLTHPLCSHPEKQVERLASKYKRIGATHPMLQEILKKPEKFSSIWDVINRQLSLIKSRSQAFEDGEITVYDKALLVLSDNGNNVKNHGALNLYLEEFIGIAQDSEFQKMNDAFNWHVALKGFFVKVSQYNEETPSFGGKGEKIMPDSNGLHLEEADKDRSSDSVITTSADEKVARIISIYLRAKDDYFSLDDSNITEKLRAARFLRDTAENSLNYLHALDCMEHGLVPELEEIFEQAKNKATQLSGGRKRRFEISEAASKRLRVSNPGCTDRYRPS